MNEVSNISRLKSLLSQPNVKQKISEILGKNASTFTTSVVQIVMNNNYLANAEPGSIFNAAMMAATLNLPLNNNLGFAHIVPFRNSRENKVEAQFQIGYKGFIQLAQRSGQFKTISAATVYDGQLVLENPLTGYEFDWSNKQGVNEEPIGYVSYFKLLNGFEAMLYMSKDDVVAHAGRYSQSFKRNAGVWTDNFEAMALKTVLKLLLSKYAPLSIEMQKAVEADQAIVKDLEGNFSYEDNKPVIEHESRISDDKARELRQLIEATGNEETKVLSWTGRARIEDMSDEQAQKAINKLKQAFEKQYEEQEAQPAAQQQQDDDEIPV